MRETVIEALQILAWPAAVLVITVIGFFVFRKNIAGLLDRTRRVGPTGLAVDAPAQVQAPPPDVPRAPAAVPPAQGAQGDAQQAFMNPLLVRVGQELLQGVQALRGAEREQFIVRAWARAAIELHFERVWAGIYRSQFDALEFLNAVPEGILRDQLKQPFYDAAALRYPDTYANYTFDQWLGFLVRSGLVSVEGNNVVLNLDGREFLAFAVRCGYTPVFKRN